MIKNQYTGQFLSEELYSSDKHKTVITDGDLNEAIDIYEEYKSIPIEHNNHYVPLYGWTRICRLCQFPMTLKEFNKPGGNKFQNHTVIKHTMISPKCQQTNALTLKLKTDWTAKYYHSFSQIETDLIENSKLISERINNLNHYADFNPIPTTIKKGTIIQLLGNYPKSNNKFWKIFGY